MASTITCTLSTTNAFAVNGQPANFVLNVTNGGAANFTLAGLSIYSGNNNNVGVNFGDFCIGPSTTLVVPASGSNNYPVSGVFFANVQSQQPEFLASVNANAVVTDGTVGTSNTVNMVVVPPQTPTVALAVPPVAGQFRFDTNFNSGLIAILSL